MNLPLAHAWKSEKHSLPESLGFRTSYLRTCHRDELLFIEWHTAQILNVALGENGSSNTFQAAILTQVLVY